MRLIDRSSLELIKIAELYDKGLPPVAGGSLDQSQWFLSAARYCWSAKVEIEDQETLRAMKHGA